MFQIIRLKTFMTIGPGFQVSSKVSGDYAI